LVRSRDLSTLADDFRLAARGFPAGNDHGDSTSLRDSRTDPAERIGNQAAVAGAANDHQLGMPRVAEQGLHRIICGHKPAHYDVGVARLPVGQCVRPPVIGIEMHGIAKSVRIGGRTVASDGVQSDQLHGPSRCLIERDSGSQFWCGGAVNTDDNRRSARLQS
jgi:hypothetical protein